MEYIFRAENVDKKYDKHQALSNVSVSIPRQGIFGLLGPNGAGKTTFIRIINQIIAPDAGKLFFKGEKLKPSHISSIGYLPEERGLYKKMKVGEQAIYLARLKDVSSRDAKKLLKEWFEKFDLMPWWDRKVEELSKGMQQKLQFIITVLHKPDLLIFDEPFSGFDPININLLKEEILKLRNNGTSVIFSTHNMSSVEELCDHIALINNSEKILDGKLENIKRAHADKVFSVSAKAFTKPFDAVFHPLADIIDKYTIKDGASKLRVRLADAYNANNLIEHILPNLQLLEFKEELPTMNDIFIKTVTGKNPGELKKDDLKAYMGMNQA